MNLPTGKKELAVDSIFSNGTKLRDTYSGKEVVVTNGKVTVDSEFTFVLLELKN